MRRNFLFSGFLLGLLFIPPPSFATSFSASSSLDWSALTMTGIDFSLSNLVQHTSGGLFGVTSQGIQSASSVTESFDWGTSNVAVALPSFGSVTTTNSNTELRTSFSLVGDNTTVGGHDTVRQTLQLSPRGS